MRKYKSLGYRDISRGRVFAVKNDEDFVRDSKHMIGENIRIDKDGYTVKSIESYALPIIRKGVIIGILV